MVPSISHHMAEGIAMAWQIPAPPPPTIHQLPIPFSLIFSSQIKNRENILSPADGDENEPKRKKAWSVEKGGAR